jgi:hypothetical protein
VPSSTKSAPATVSSPESAAPSVNVGDLVWCSYENPSGNGGTLATVPALVVRVNHRLSETPTLGLAVFSLDHGLTFPPCVPYSPVPKSKCWTYPTQDVPPATYKHHREQAAFSALVTPPEWIR